MSNFDCPLVFISGALSGIIFPKLAKNSATYENKVKHAVQSLLENPHHKLWQAMLVTLFKKKDLVVNSLTPMVAYLRPLKN